MHETSPPAAPPGHESSALGAGRIAWFSVALCLLIGLAALAAIALVGGLRLPSPVSQPSPQAREAETPPAPQLQSAPAGDLRAYRQEKEVLLRGYRWVDPSAGVLQIPIERAMQLTVARQAPRPVPPPVTGPTQ